MNFEIQMTGADVVLKDLNRMERALKNPRRSLVQIGADVQEKAQKYAPISPNQKQKNALKKTKRKGNRKKSATTRAKPGSLQHSIRFDVISNDSVKIHVPSNSPAGKYGYKIHEEKGRTWRNRGIGTQIKGAQADDKFIERAARDLTPRIEEIIRTRFERDAGLI